jgi:hypothetical protein
MEVAASSHSHVEFMIKRFSRDLALISSTVPRFVVISERSGDARWLTAIQAVGSWTEVGLQ